MHPMPVSLSRPIMQTRCDALPHEAMGSWRASHETCTHMPHDPSPLGVLPGRPTRPIRRESAPASEHAAHAARHWIIGPRADLDGFLCQVAAVCEATGPGGGPPDILWLREIAKVYGLLPAEG